MIKFRIIRRAFGPERVRPLTTCPFILFYFFYLVITRARGGPLSPGTHKPLLGASLVPPRWPAAAFWAAIWGPKARFLLIF